MSKDKTNLASEFHVLSVLNRLEADAYLTLGNKKSVDIVVVRADGQTVNVEVKAVAGAHDWTVGVLKATTLNGTLSFLSASMGISLIHEYCQRAGYCLIKQHRILWLNTTRRMGFVEILNVPPSTSSVGHSKTTGRQF